MGVAHKSFLDILSETFRGIDLILRKLQKRLIGDDKDIKNIPGLNYLY